MFQLLMRYICLKLKTVNSLCNIRIDADEAITDANYKRKIVYDNEYRKNNSQTKECVLNTNRIEYHTNKIPCHIYLISLTIN